MKFMMILAFLISGCATSGKIDSASKENEISNRKPAECMGDCGGFYNGGSKPAPDYISSENFLRALPAERLELYRIDGATLRMGILNQCTDYLAGLSKFADWTEKQRNDFCDDFSFRFCPSRDQGCR